MYQIYADGKLIYQPANERLRLTSPRLTVEMGKAGSLEFGIPPTNSYYGNLQQLKAILTVTEDGDEIFRGRVLSNTKNFNLIRTIYGEGDLSYLIDTVQNPEKFDGSSTELFTKIIEKHNQMVQGSEKVFTVGDVTVDERKVYVAGKSENIIDKETNKFDYNQIVINGEVGNWQTSFDYLECSLIDYCGGYLRTRYDKDLGITYIDWLKDHYAESTQTISFGRNLLDLTEENNAEDAFSVLIPLGEENLTIKSVNNGSNELVNEEALERYGRIVKTNVFEGVTSAKTLMENGQRYLAEHAIPPITFTVTAVDMHLLNPGVQPIRLGDKVHVLSPGHGVDDPDLICTKIVYDLANPANTSYTFGKPKQSLTERYRQDRKPEKGGGGGGGAAKQAEEASTENQIDFYKAWINTDSEHGIIDLNTLFTRVWNPGGDPDNPVDQKIVTGTKILLGSDADGSAIDLVSSFKSRCDNIANQAGVNVVTGPNGPEVHIYVQDDNTHELAEINLGVQYNTSVVEDQNGNTHVQYTPQSSIAMNSDLMSLHTTVFDLLTESGTIKANKLSIMGEDGNISFKYLTFMTNSGYIDVPGVYASYFFLKGNGNRDIKDHRHKLTVETNGEVKLGELTWEDSTFNIADTKFFKDSISAVKIKSLEMFEDETNFVAYIKPSKQFSVPIHAILNNGTIGATNKIYVDAKKAYDHGAKEVSVTSCYVPGNAGTASPDGEGGYWCSATVRIYLSNGEPYQTANISFRA